MGSGWEIKKQNLNKKKQKSNMQFQKRKIYETQYIKWVERRKRKTQWLNEKLGNSWN